MSDLGELTCRTAMRGIPERDSQRAALQPASLVLHLLQAVKADNQKTKMCRYTGCGALHD